MQACTGLAVCRHLLPEARACCRQRRLDAVALLPLQPRCERPWRTWDSLRTSLEPAAGSCDTVVVVGAGCLPAGEPSPGPVRLGVVRSSTCFSLLAGETAVDAWVSRGCYLVTPGWLRQWRDAIAAWGYDVATARAHFAEFAQAVLLLDTGLDAGASSRLHDFAQWLALREEVEPVALDAFGDRLARAVGCRP
jgi:hypothetical protein